MPLGDRVWTRFLSALFGHHPLKLTNKTFLKLSHQTNMTNVCQKTRQQKASEVKGKLDSKGLGEIIILTIPIGKNQVCSWKDSKFSKFSWGLLMSSIFLYSLLCHASPLLDCALPLNKEDIDI